MKVDMTPFFCPELSDLDEIWQTVHNDMPTAVTWSKSKPERKFQYGGRLFFLKNGNSYISAMD